MTTLSPSRYEESPGFGPHKAGHPTGGRVGYHADSNSVFPTSHYRPWKTQRPPAWLGRGCGPTRSMLSLQLHGMGGHTTSQSLGTGGRDPFGGVHSDDCRKGTGAGPVPITSQLVPTESRYVVGRAGLEPATQGL